MGNVIGGSLADVKAQALVVLAVDANGNAITVVTPTGAAGSFVNVSGDSMTGSLTMTGGASVLVGTSGLGNLGSVAAPFSNLNTQTGTFGTVLASSSGTATIGSLASPFSGVFAIPIVKSPDGQSWMLTVSNTGMVTGVSYP